MIPDIRASLKISPDHSQLHAGPCHLHVIQSFCLVFPSQAHNLVPSNLAQFPLPLAPHSPLLRPRTLETGQPYLVSCKHTPRLSPEHVSGLILLGIPVSVTLVQAFISFCWDPCSSLPTDFLSFSLALSSLFAILLLLTSCPISPALSATVSLCESVMLRRVPHGSCCSRSSLF